MLTTKARGMQHTERTISDLISRETRTLKNKYQTAIQKPYIVGIKQSPKSVRFLK